MIRDSLWRRVVGAKCGVDPFTMLPNIVWFSRKWSLFNLIGSLFYKNKGVSSIVQQDFRTVIENGFNADFWLEDWTGRGILKHLFPCVFALAIVKESLIANFGDGIKTFHIGRFYLKGGLWIGKSKCGKIFLTPSRMCYRMQTRQIG